MTHNAQAVLPNAFIVVLLVVITVLSVSAESSLRALGEKKKANPAADIYVRDCARCHGGDGSGDTPMGQMHKVPDFTDPDWWKINSPLTTYRSHTSIVTNGKGEMPAFGKKLKRSEINQLVEYVRRFRKPNNTPASRQ